MNNYEKLYISALDELKRDAAKLADSMLRASAAAQLFDPRGEKNHPAGDDAAKACRESFVHAFAKVPGMKQLFFGGK